MDYVNILKELCTNTAVSGYEKDMAEYVGNLFSEHCDNVEIDGFYNVIGHKRGFGEGKFKIMISAHYDEIGMMVKGIEDGGFLRVTNIGGIDSKILLAQEVVVHGKRKVTGVIGAKPPHLLKPEETSKAVKLEDLYIDVGMKTEALKENVGIGDLVTFKADFIELKGGKLSSKSMDNRCGAAVLVGIMEGLSKVRHEADIYFVATTQEETRCTGAEIIAYNLQPNVAFIIDACHGDMADAPRDDTYALGKGAAIGLGPNLHKKLTQRLMSLCKEENIPYQVDIEPGDTGTEAWVIQVSRFGIPSLLVSVPVRYMHTTVETLNIDDLKSAVRMVTAFVKEIEPDKEGITCL